MDQWDPKPPQGEKRKKFNKTILELTLKEVGYAESGYKHFNFQLSNGYDSKIKSIYPFKQHLILFKTEKSWIKRAEMWYYASNCEYELQGLKFFD
jgi:hypothetical protein